MNYQIRGGERGRDFFSLHDFVFTSANVRVLLLSNNASFTAKLLQVLTFTNSSFQHFSQRFKLINKHYYSFLVETVTKLNKCPISSLYLPWKFMRMKAKQENVRAWLRMWVRYEGFVTLFGGSDPSSFRLLQSTVSLSELCSTTWLPLARQ